MKDEYEYMNTRYCKTSSVNVECKSMLLEFINGYSTHFLLKKTSVKFIIEYQKCKSCNVKVLRRNTIWKHCKCDYTSSGWYSLFSNRLNDNTLQSLLANKCN